MRILSPPPRPFASCPGDAHASAGKRYDEPFTTGHIHGKGIQYRRKQNSSTESWFIFMDRERQRQRETETERESAQDGWI